MPLWTFFTEKRKKMDDNYPQLLKDTPAFFVTREGYNEETYGENVEIIWEVTAAGYHGRYSVRGGLSRETYPPELLRREYAKQAIRKGIEWDRWPIVRLAD
jgi:hypothetical protein